MKTLKELLKSLKGKIPDKQRVYSVKHKASGTVDFVCSNSPGNAAQESCEVETVGQKALIAAAVEALGELAKEKA